MIKWIEIAKKIWQSEFCSGYFTFIALTFSSLFFVRISCLFLFDFAGIASNHFYTIQLIGFWNDILFVSPFLILLSPVYFFLIRAKKWFADLVLLTVLVVYLILETLLEWYFSISVVPLTYQTLVGVSDEQALQVAAIYGFQKWQMLGLIPVALILFLMLWKSRKFASKKIVRKVVAMIFMVTLVSSVFTRIESQDFESELNFQIATNKLDYFTSSYFVYSNEKWQQENIEVNEELQTFYEVNNIEKRTYYEYPFYSDTPLKNPLGPFFPERDSAPNVVFIICESLGKHFSGEDARLGSFTPFLDSLAEHSLYWSNFMSNAERTFGALPNLLAGLPEGEIGFMSLKQNMPDHLSLPQLLKENNGYQTAFFCGADKKFDNMDQFLMAQKFDLIKSKTDFTLNESKTQIEDHKGKKIYFNWGAEDQVVFDQSFRSIDSSFDKHKPYFNVYLTTSFHEPFNYTGRDFFIDQAKRRITEMNPENRVRYNKNVETFAALMYMDDALRKFFEIYRSRADFANTIFVICGDHSIKFIGNDTRLEKFHVPLLIYSPMLKEGRRIKSMACHKDVPSAIQGLLKENFGLNLPDFSISQSDNLRTEKFFSADNSNYALMYADKRINSYVWEEFLYMDETLFRIEDNLKLARIDSSELAEVFYRRITNYRLINNYVCVQNKFIPDSVFSIFSQSVALIKRDVDFEQEIGGPGHHFAADMISDEVAYSGKRSLTNLNEPYFTLLKNFRETLSKRLRLRIGFVIRSKTGELPALIIYRRAIIDGKEQEVDQKTILLDKATGTLSETEKAGWYQVQTGCWFDELPLGYNDLKMGAYFFSKDSTSYFVDDLKVELRQF